MRNEQAGFRPKRGTTEQIFILRNILEQTNEWRAALIILFIDFEKAFDSVHRESLWYIMKSYGIPDKIIRTIKEIYKGFKCSVIDQGETSEWFEIKSGVKQGCVMSGFLFLLVIDWIMRKTTADKARGIRWNFNTVLEDLDFADDIALLSSKFSDLDEKTQKLTTEAERIGMKLNPKKCKTLRSQQTKNKELITLYDQKIEDVDKFTYLGAVMDKEGGGSCDIKNRIQKARGTFHRLRNIWYARGIGRKTKIHLYKSLVRPVLLYGCETWKLTNIEEKKLNTVEHQCLRKILKIRWQSKTSNKTVNEIANTRNISCEIRRRRWTWIGHTLRRERDNNSYIALQWAPEGKRTRGRPKTTWRRTTERERNQQGWTSWNVARTAAKDRKGWKNSVEALCDFWRGEN